MVPLVTRDARSCVVSDQVGVRELLKFAVNEGNDVLLLPALKYSVETVGGNFYVKKALDFAYIFKLKTPPQERYIIAVDNKRKLSSTCQPAAWCPIDMYLAEKLE